MQQAQIDRPNMACIGMLRFKMKNKLFGRCKTKLIYTNANNMAYSGMIWA